MEAIINCRAASVLFIIVTALFVIDSRYSNLDVATLAFGDTHTHELKNLSKVKKGRPMTYYETHQR